MLDARRADVIHSRAMERRAGENADQQTVAGFGDEWSKFDQSGVDEAELLSIFERYFAIFPWSELPASARGIDVGCGSGRWAKLVAPKVGWLHGVDASESALRVAAHNLASCPNTTLLHASVGALPFADGTFDFGYSLGVLHHVPDTAAGIRECVRVLKPGAPFLLYLYYAFDNRPAWYRGVWQASDAVRKVVCRMPQQGREAVAELLAASVYWPLARAARQVEKLGVDVSLFPLASYRDRSFYIMRNDALDRFGTRLEQRFTRAEIEQMMLAAGLSEVRFHDGFPFWCALGFKK